MIKELEQYLKDKIELESKVLSLKDTIHNQNHTISNLRKELEEVEKRIEDKLEKKYEKELQKLTTSTLRIRVLEEYVRDCRSKVDRYEKEIEELEEDLVDCFNKIGALDVDLDELRSHHSKLKNHWLVKLLRL